MCIKWIDSILNFIYPMAELCPLCGEISLNNLVCETCKKGIKYVTPPYCEKCGRKFKGLKPHDWCPECKAESKSFDVAFSTFVYDGIIKHKIISYKFYGASHLASYFASAMEETFQQKGFLPDCITWVPLHPKREAQRGYNQSQLLALMMGRRLGLKAEDLLVRKRNTKAQATLDRAQRHKNLKQAIFCNKDITGWTVLLIDDVFTTGATAESCAKALKEKGAKTVFVQTLAAGEALS